MSNIAVVTGAGGFIGRHLARHLASLGAEVRAVDVRPAPGEPWVAGPGVTWHRVDIRETAALEPVLEGADTVYHLASAHLEVNAGIEAFRAVNVGAAERLVRACAGAGVRRLVHTSTVGIYGHVRQPPAREDTPPAPGNMYEVTKLEGERAVRAAAAAAGLESIILRPAWVYGIGCPRLAKLLRSVERARFVYVGSGRNLRHPIHVDDAVAAFVRASTAAVSAPASAYIIAGPRYMPLREMVECVARAVGVEAPTRRLPRSLMLAAGRAAEIAWGVAGRQPPFSRRSIAFFENDNAFDISAARRELGFEPVIDLAEGLRRTLSEREMVAA